ncbi:MAG: CDP-alcohol phosphatidyltransferase family protein [Bacteroidetes bacterium]|nr:CDP-alcohol phosphatidyltransferase family protein [Bacteroidota bacterium]
MNNKIWTISNFLSFTRILLTIPTAYFLYTPSEFHREIAVLILLLAALTDLFDGYLARVLNQISEFGKIIDPLADKVGIGIVIVLLAIFGDIPLWFLILVIGRDVIIFSAGMYVKLKKGIILTSTMEGKVAVGFIALALLTAILRYPSLSKIFEYLIWLSVISSVYSLIVYGKRFFKTISSQKET